CALTAMRDCGVVGVGTVIRHRSSGCCTRWVSNPSFAHRTAQTRNQSLSAVSRRSKTNQTTTPKHKSEFRSSETVTVTDPRHPLYGRTFALISIEERKDRGKVCLVVREWGQNTYLPIEVTDRATQTAGLFPIPLSASALQQLVKIY